MSADQEIEGLNGATEYKQFCKEFIRVNRTAKKHRFALNFPALIMVTGSGQGNTTYLNLLAKLMKEEHMLYFSGEEDVFEWRMMDTDEEAISKLLRRMEQAAGFYPYFSGVIGLDLSKLENWNQPDHQLFELIRDHRQKVLFCLQISKNQADSRMAEFEEELRAYVQVKTVNLISSQHEFCQYIREEIKRQGFRLAEGTEEAVRTLAAAVGKGGYRSIQLAVDEIIWKKLSSNNGFVIEAEDLMSYQVVLHRKRENKKAQRLIGFGAQDL